MHEIINNINSKYPDFLLFYVNEGFPLVNIYDLLCLPCVRLGPQLVGSTIEKRLGLENANITRQ